MLRFAPLMPKDAGAWAELLAVSFERSPADMHALLDWMHAGYPIVAWGAWDDDRLAAQYSCRLVDLHLPGEDQPALAGMSINMAVHPDYRGQGLIKHLAQPVYEQVAALGGVAGVGFSNAEGVKVDLKSKSYGYRVVGEMVSMAIWTSRSRAEKLELTAEWPEGKFTSAPTPSRRFQLTTTPEGLCHRFACHPFRHYRYGVWRDKTGIRGIVVYRPMRYGPLHGVSLLAAYSDDLEELLSRWISTLCEDGLRLIHVLTSPKSAIRGYLRTLGFSVDMPCTRTPYFLTAKPLAENTPPDFFNFARWDCLGGDVL